MDMNGDQDAVVITENRHVTTFGPQGQLVKRRRVSIFVGALGPFTNEFPDGQDTPAQIQTWIQNEKAAAIGLRNAVR